MLGKSVYLTINKEAVDKTIASLRRGDICFTSLHNPEDFVEGFKEKARQIIEQIQAKGAVVVADVSPKGLAQLGFSSLVEAAQSGMVDAFRTDFGFSAEEIAQASQYCGIVFNASVIDVDLVKMLTKSGGKVAAMHNFYPRPDTGMDEDYIKQRNLVLHKSGVEVWAFTSGDDALRGPIFEGLPTVEDYRNLPPYVQYVLLKKKLDVDVVFVGDVTLTDFSERLIATHEKTGVLQLPVNMNPEFCEALCNKVLTIRYDSNSRVARIVESREYANNGPVVEPDGLAMFRKAGSITVDNANYKRYSGEVQIVRRDLSADERVNVIGNLLPEYIALLEMCTGDVKIQFVC